MKRNRWSTRLACGLLVAATTLGVALAAGTQGSQSDPLVTLSYLNEKVIPDVMKQVDEHIKVKTAELVPFLPAVFGLRKKAFLQDSITSKSGPSPIFRLMSISGSQMQR